MAGNIIVTRRALRGALLLVALVPFATAAIRAVIDGWYPVGDDALYAIRALDVGTEHHPLLGPWSSASQSSGVDVNHPGPLLFDLLALPARIDPTAGIAAGMAIINAAMVAAMAWVAHRIGGDRLAVVVLASATVLVWSLGSSMIVDPWQPNAMVLPYLLFLVLIWAVWSGRDWFLLPAVAVGSLLVQTHLSYIVVVPLLLLASMVAVVVRARREAPPRDRPAAAPEGDPPQDRSRTVRVLGASVGIGLLLWSQPLIEQIDNGSEGNLQRLLETRGGDEERSGALLGARLVAGVLANPPFWARPSYGATYLEPVRSADPSPAEADASGLPSATAATVGLGGLGLLLGSAVVRARRSGDRVLVAGVATAVAGLACAFVNAAIQPFNPVLGIGGHQVAWLWPTGAFLAAAAAAVIRSRYLAPLAAALLVVAALGALPAHDGGMGPRRDRFAEPALRALARELEPLKGGAYVVDPSDLYFAEPYSTPFMFELRRQGIDFYVEEPGLIRQLGERRRAPEVALERLRLQIGPGALQPPPEGSRRVARVNGFDRVSRERLEQLTEQVRRLVASGGLDLTDTGRDALRSGDLPVTASSGLDAAHELIESRELVVLVRERLVSAGTEGQALLERWAALQHRSDELTVAVLVEGGSQHGDAG